MITLFILLLFASSIIIFTLVVSIFKWKKHFSIQKRYLLEEQKDNLIFLVAEGKLGLNDDLYVDTIGHLQSFEKICDHFSMKDLILDFGKTKNLPFEQYVIRLSHNLSTANKEVRDSVLKTYETFGKIVLRNSLTVSVIFFFFRKILVKLPGFLTKLLSRFFKTKWQTLTALIVFEDKFKLRYR